MAADIKCENCGGHGNVAGHWCDVCKGTGVTDKELSVGSVYRHLKTGHEYVVLALARIDADLTPAVVYALNSPKAQWGVDCWVRPTTEFIDGRFAYVGEKRGKLEIHSAT